MYNCDFHRAIRQVLFIVIGFFMSSCAENIPGDILENSMNEIMFSVSDDMGNLVLSRGTTTKGFSVGDEIGVFAYRVNDGEATEFMHNQKVIYDGASWKYTPVKYWPQKGDVVFYAYMPYSESMSMSYDEKKIDWAVPTDVKEQKDFLTAKSLVAEGNRKQVDLGFSHTLSKIVFKSSKPVSDLKIGELSLSGTDIKDMAVWNFEEDNWSDAAKSEQSTLTTYKFLPNGTLKEIVTSTDEIMEENQAAFLLPQSTTDLNLYVKYNMAGEDRYLEGGLDEAEWQKGKGYTYVIDFDKGVSVAPFDDYITLDYVESVGMYKHSDSGYVLDMSKPNSVPIDLGFNTNGGTYGVRMICQSVCYEENGDGYIIKTSDDTYPFGGLAKGRDENSLYDDRFYGVGFVGKRWQCGWGDKMYKSNVLSDYNFFRKYEYQINYKNDGNII